MVERDPAFVKIDLEIAPGDIPGSIAITVHTSVIQDMFPNITYDGEEEIERFYTTIHRIVCDKVKEWPDADFAPIKAELLKILPASNGHFEKGVWVQEKGE